MRTAGSTERYVLGFLRDFYKESTDRVCTTEKFYRSRKTEDRRTFSVPPFWSRAHDGTRITLPKHLLPLKHGPLSRRSTGNACWGNARLVRAVGSAQMGHGSGALTSGYAAASCGGFQPIGFHLQAHCSLIVQWKQGALREASSLGREDGNTVLLRRRKTDRGCGARLASKLDSTGCGSTSLPSTFLLAAKDLDSAHSTLVRARKKERREPSKLTIAGSPLVHLRLLRARDRPYFEASGSCFQ